MDGSHQSLVPPPPPPVGAMPVRGGFSFGVAENGENVDDDEDIVIKWFMLLLVLTG